MEQTSYQSEGTASLRAEALSSRASVISKQASIYIPSLDGIRAASFLIVFLAHAGLEQWVPGYFGLTLFFFLSGYLITTLLRIEYDKLADINFRNFYLRRILRIFPPFYLVLAGATVLTTTGVLQGPSLDLSALLFQASHLTNYYIIHAGWWDGRAPGTWVFWSLAVEEHFYLVFPLLYLFLRRRLSSGHTQAAALLGICLAILAWRCILVFGLDVAKERTYLASDTRVDSILFGCILAVYGNPALDTTRVSERRWKWFWLPVGCVVILLSFVIRVPEYEQTLRYTLQGVGLLPVFVVAIRYHDWFLIRPLNAPWIRFLGVISYSMYLLHTVVIWGVTAETTWHPIVQGIAALGLTIVLAVAIYRFVEQPCARLRKHISSVSAPPISGVGRGSQSPGIAIAEG